MAPYPTYRQLPIDPDKPPKSSWGVFGEDDQLGTLNLLTAERVLYATSLVRRGALFPLNWEIDKPSPPLFDRQPLQHTIFQMGEGTDDRYDAFYPQGSTQWDALSHIGHPQYGFYNGCARAEITGRPGSRNGIDNSARRGIAGRFVLADVARYRASLGRPIKVAESDAISVDDIDKTLAWENVSLRGGDILLLRFGWIEWYEATDQATRDKLHVQLPDRSYLDGPRVLMSEIPSFVGLDRAETTAEWMWDHQVAALAADSPALEVMPFDMTRPDGFLHYRVLALLGMTLGELFAMDRLAADCAADHIYEGLLTSTPLNKVGGSGSPANALAIK
jgi:kynurenine formamidase